MSQSHLNAASDGTPVNRVDGLYDAYVPTVSTAEMATSREMAQLLHGLASLEQVKTILDLGSGLSSAVFRLTRKPVVTYDDDPDWLERTRRFLRAQDLPTEGLRMWPCQPLNERRFDLVFHDLGNMRTREASLLNALNASRMLTVLDDIHWAQYAAIVDGVVSLIPGVRRISLYDATRDRFGRFGLALLWERPVVRSGPV